MNPPDQPEPAPQTAGSTRETLVSDTANDAWYPLTFDPHFMQRVWGGRRLESLYGKVLPDPPLPFGESWEISDRPEAVSVVNRGHFIHRDLHWLMTHHRTELLGENPGTTERFPLLVKILDAREKLSLQVHPPAAVAPRLQGEPKTEMWYVTHADPGAELHVGIKRGVTRALFEQRLRDGNVADCFHRVPVRSGTVMFLPSGRVHAIGGGIVLFEIQQNSNTTFRVHDWNRPGLDGKPRELHVEESLQCIDFDDLEPEAIRGTPSGADGFQRRDLIRDPLFTVREYTLEAGREFVGEAGGRAVIVAVAAGRLKVGDGAGSVDLDPGRFCLLPACLGDVRMRADHRDAKFLWARVG